MRLLMVMTVHGSAWRCVPEQRVSREETQQMKALLHECGRVPEGVAAAALGDLSGDIHHALIAHGMPVHKATVMVKGLDKRSKMDPCGRAGDGEPKGRVLRTRIECMLVPNTPANTVYEVLSYCEEMDVASYKIDLQHALISITHWR